MYSRVVPMYNDKSEVDRLPFDESLDACDERNFSKFGDFEDEQVVTIHR